MFIDLNSWSISEILDLLGTFAFAISGIRFAASRDFDLFGAYVVGLITAIGGGTTRDLLLNVRPFWMEEIRYLLVTGVALLMVFFFREKLLKIGKALFVFDAVGLGLFTISGIEKSIELGMPVWVSLIMGMISGAVGGVIRDVVINETPMLFKKDLYALACLAGGLAYVLTQNLGSWGILREIIAAGIIVAIRLLAVKYKLGLPKLKPLKGDA